MPSSATETVSRPESEQTYRYAMAVFERTDFSRPLFDRQAHPRAPRRNPFEEKAQGLLNIRHGAQAGVRVLEGNSESYDEDLRDGAFDHIALEYATKLLQNPQQSITERLEEIKDDLIRIDFIARQRGLHLAGNAPEEEIHAGVFARDIDSPKPRDLPPWYR